MTGKKEFRLTGRHVLWSLIGFFGVIFAANGVLVYLAVGSFSGVVDDDAYERGLRYNEQIAQREELRELGWVMDVALEETAGELVLTLKDKTGAALSGLKLEGVLKRPVDKAQDRALAFLAQEGGRYVARVPDLPAGQWDLEVSAAAPGGMRFQAVRRL